MNEQYFEHSLYEMSNFRSDRTGLSPGITMWVRTEPTGLLHSKYRVKFDHPQHGSAVFALWGDEPIQVAGNWIVSGKDLHKIQTLVATSINDIRSHIDGTEDSADLGDALKMNSKVIQQI